MKGLMPVSFAETGLINSNPVKSRPAFLMLDTQCVKSELFIFKKIGCCQKIANNQIANTETAR